MRTAHGRVGEPASHPFYALDQFAKGYVEAMFFTNGDTGDEREDCLNDLGVERLTAKAVADITAQCEAFQRTEAPALRAAYATGYTQEQAGRDFWFSRQGHGAGFFDRDLPNAIKDELQDAARSFGEAMVETARGWIYHS